MREPTVYVTTCPHCKQASSVRMSDSAHWWLPDSSWRCPHCKQWVRREDWVEPNTKEKKP